MDNSVKTSWLREHTLKAAGITYLLGDACLFLSGLISGRIKEAMAGLFYAAGGVVSALFGNPSAPQQIQNVGVRMGDFMMQHGAQIPSCSALKAILQKRHGGLKERIENFLYRHPAETHNAIFAYGGLKLMQSGLGKRTGGWEDVAAGGLVTGGGLVGAFVPEKPTGNWITQKPLRLAGALYTLNNILLIKSGWGEYKDNPAQRSYIFKFLAATFFMAGNAFMSLSSRNHSGESKGDNHKHQRIEIMAAEVIAAQPESIRAVLIRQVAGFLSMQPETRQDMLVLMTSLEQKVAALRQPQVIAKPLSPATTTWQEKMRLSPAEGIIMRASS